MASTRIFGRGASKAHRCCVLTALSATASAQETELHPSDLKHWKLTLPLDLNGDGKADEVSNLWGYSNQPCFHATPQGMVFRAHAGGARTRGSTAYALASSALAVARRSAVSPGQGPAVKPRTRHAPPGYREAASSLHAQCLAAGGSFNPSPACGRQGFGRSARARRSLPA